MTACWPCEVVDLPYSLSGGPVRLAAERGEKRGEARVAGQGAGRSAAQRGQRQRRESTIVHLKLLPGLVEDHPALAERSMVS